MRIEKNALAQQSDSNRVQDQYGILQLTINATLTRMPKLSKLPKVTLCLRLKLMQWASNTLAIIRILCIKLFGKSVCKSKRRMSNYGLCLFLLSLKILIN